MADLKSFWFRLYHPEGFGLYTLNSRVLVEEIRKGTSKDTIP